MARGVRSRFKSAEEFYEHASEGKQILSGFAVQVERDHDAYMSYRLSSNNNRSHRKVLESMLSEQAETHYRDPATVTLFFEKLLAIPCENWDKYLNTELMMESRRLGFLRSERIVALLTSSAQAQLQLPRNPAVAKLFAESEEKESIQSCLKNILFGDPLLFVKGKDHVMQVICSLSSWGPSLTFGEKVIRNAPYLRHANCPLFS